MAETPHVVNTTAQSFSKLVIEASHQQPVLVDFWADWCAPCRMLMPLLAKLAAEYGGKFVVAKVNTEEERDLAARFGIRSLPTVQLFKDGRPVDQFAGALPESEVRTFIDRHIPREADPLLLRAEALMAQGAMGQAAELIAQALASDPAYPQAILANIRLKAHTGRIEEAELALAQLPPDQQAVPEVSSLRAWLGFATTAAKAPVAAELERTLADHPDDNDARFGLAARRVMEKDYAGALELLLQLVLKDRKWGNDAGRRGMLQIFEILGGSGDLVSQFRNRMFNALH